MNKDNWMEFVQSYWRARAYWQYFNLIGKEGFGDLSKIFFDWIGTAVRNELLMKLDHCVHLAGMIADEHDVGDAARNTLERLRAVHAKGDTRDRSELSFEDCGIKPFRDKLIAHPLNVGKAVLGKPEYKISLSLATVEQTLNLIKQFADEAEQHNLPHWESSCKENIGFVEASFSSIACAIEAAAKYESLKHEIALKGRAMVEWNWEKDEIVILPS